MSEIATPEIETDDFTAAFDELAALGDAPAPVAPAAEPAEIPDPAASADPSEATAAAGEPSPAATPGDTPSDAPSSGRPASAETPPPVDAEAIFNRLGQLIERVPAPQPAAAPEPAAAEEPELPLYTADEQKTLTDFVNDWPEVAAAQTLRERALARQLVQHIFSELRPIVEMVESIATEQHYAQLSTQIEDYSTIRDQVVAWVAEQPSIVRPAYEQVVQQGTPQQVQELVALWRQNTGAAPAATPSVTPAAPAASPPKKSGTVLPAATKQAVASLAPVSSKRSAVAPTIDSNDFDSAFERAARDQ